MNEQEKELLVLRKKKAKILEEKERLESEYMALCRELQELQKTTILVNRADLIETDSETVHERPRRFWQRKRNSEDPDQHESALLDEKQSADENLVEEGENTREVIVVEGKEVVFREISRGAKIWYYAEEAGRMVVCVAAVAIISMAVTVLMNAGFRTLLLSLFNY